ncbi:MAG: helix-turn-helix transcriptional regulator [Bacteroidetes bacterium]|nr:helix-turn-helix transcriptional regulator [Bacteroidota bacterium]
MQKEKLYRESELKLETLASKLNVPKHYVSQIINQYYKVNYFEYINLLRIDEAKLLLVAEDKKSMNIIEVAYWVGYNTKNTFNNAFRRIVGVTPTEYRRQHQIRMN